MIFAKTMVVLLGFAALAIDTAHAFVERRDSKTTADVAELGAALTLVDNPGTDKQIATGLVDQVMNIAALNLGPDLDWEGCTDPDRPEKYSETAKEVFILGLDDQYTDCISWTENWLSVRVRVPYRQIDTFFASLIGFDTVPVGAFAEVGAVKTGYGGVLPLGVLTTGAEGIICVKTGPGFPPECDPNVSGNFQFLDFLLFGNDSIGTTEKCSGQTVDTLKENIAHGVDHDLAVAPNNPITEGELDDEVIVVKEHEQCPGSDVGVQAVKSETGVKQKVIQDGLIDGINGFPGRLTLGTPARSFNLNGTMIDDIGLWEYLNVTGKTLCPDADDEGSIATCVEDNPTVELFDDRIEFSPRLAKVPILWQGDWPDGSKIVSFKAFRYIYLQGLYGGCTGSGGCKLVIQPGLTGEKLVTDDDPLLITAIGIPDVHISQEVRDRFGELRVTSYSLIR
jgi:hypothetical protein